MATTEPLIVLASFVGKVNDEERIFREGELIAASDPAVKKWPDKFGPARFPHEQRAVEQATRAPGERR